MDIRKPLNFAQALRSKPGAATADSHPAESELAAVVDSQIPTTAASQIPPPSLLPTTTPEPAIKIAKRGKVDSHKSRKVDSRKVKSPASLLASDDRELMILFKTEPSIINLYLRYNPENRWKPSDDHEGARYNGRDIRLIEVGIIQTQFNARFKKINSFKYYTVEIDVALETPLTDEVIEIMLKQGRRRWQEATGK